MAARKKKERVQQHTFSFAWSFIPTPEQGFCMECMCGNRWWASDESWVGCRGCHLLGFPIITQMSYQAACEAKLYRVTTGGMGHGIREDGMVFAGSNRQYPEGWSKP